MLPNMKIKSQKSDSPVNTQATFALKTAVNGTGYCCAVFLIPSIMAPIHNPIADLNS